MIFDIFVSLLLLIGGVALLAIFSFLFVFLVDKTSDYLEDRFGNQKVKNLEFWVIGAMFAVIFIFVWWAIFVGVSS